LEEKASSFYLHLYIFFFLSRFIGSLWIHKLSYPND
jgi:hypothetical protein